MIYKFIDFFRLAFALKNFDDSVFLVALDFAGFDDLGGGFLDSLEGWNEVLSAAGSLSANSRTVFNSSFPYLF
jgi:hypothetical protein